MQLSPALRLAIGRQVQQSLRAMSTAPATTSADHIHEDTLTQQQKDQHYPKIGKREIVGFGINGHPSYIDSEMFPFPAIRFREETAEVTKLRQRERGDWRKLTLDEKKTLYRHSFCQTFSEMTAPTGEWKAVIAGSIFAITIALWFIWWLKKFVYSPMPITITEEWMIAEAEEMIRQGQGRLTGISSNWDYENNCWKK